MSVAGDVGRRVAQVLCDMLIGVLSRHPRIRATANVLLAAARAYTQVIGFVHTINRGTVDALRNLWRGEQ